MASRAKARTECKLSSADCSDIDVNVRRGPFRRALQAEACYSGQTNTIRLLLDQGTDGNLFGEKMAVH